ncbi:hypothetical protein GCM10020331_013770 [Ectobacillus funiculus]
MSPLESILLENGNPDNIDISRNIVMKTVLNQLKGIIELEFEQDVECFFYHDWNYPQNTGMITVQFEGDITKQVHQDNGSIDLKPLVDEVEKN